DLERGIAEFEWSLVARSARRKVAPRKQPARPRHQEFLDVCARSTHSRCACLTVGVWRRQFPPARDHFRRGITQRWLVEYRPNVLRETRSHSLASREILQCNVTFSQRHPMLVAPSCK